MQMINQAARTSSPPDEHLLWSIWLLDLELVPCLKHLQRPQHLQHPRRHPRLVRRWVLLPLSWRPIKIRLTKNVKLRSKQTASTNSSLLRRKLMRLPLCRAPEESLQSKRAQRPRLCMITRLKRGMSWISLKARLLRTSIRLTTDGGVAQSMDERVSSQVRTVRPNLYQGHIIADLVHVFIQPIMSSSSKKTRLNPSELPRLVQLYLPLWHLQLHICLLDPTLSSPPVHVRGLCMTMQQTKTMRSVGVAAALALVNHAEWSPSLM